MSETADGFWVLVFPPSESPGWEGWCSYSFLCSEKASPWGPLPGGLSLLFLFLPGDWINWALMNARLLIPQPSARPIVMALKYWISLPRQDRTDKEEEEERGGGKVRGGSACNSLPTVMLLPSSLFLSISHCSFSFSLFLSVSFLTGAEASG